MERRRIRPVLRTANVGFWDWNIGAVGREAVLQLAHRIQRVFDDAFHIDSHRLFVTATLGISLYPDHGRESELLLRYADAALHCGKHRGKNCIQLFDPSIASDLQEWSHLKNALQAALHRNELSVVFQPQVDVDRSHIIGFEALARWLSPTLGQVAPDIFSVTAEGVETSRHLAFLRKLRCETGQGYYFSKPLLLEHANLLMHPQASNVTPISKPKS